MKLNITIFAFFILAISFQVNAQWTEISGPPTGFVTDHTIGFGLDGKGYLVAGTDELGNRRNDVYEYDPSTDSFTQKGNFPGGARGFSIGDTWNGKAYIGFGLNSNNQYLNDLWEYNPEDDSWNQLASCPCTARYHPAFIAHNDKIFVGMGSSANGNLNDWWIYDMTTNTWSQGPNFPSTTRHHPYQFAVGDYVYTGFGHGQSIYNEWYRFDPSDNTWSEMASLPGEGRVAGQQFSYNGKGYILSGEGMDHNAMDEGEFYSYDPETDSWERLPDHPGTSRWAPASFVVDDEVYLFNGIVYGFGPPTSMETAYKFTFEEEVMSSAPSLENNAAISLYPNPVSDQLMIVGLADYRGELMIVDMLGQILQTFEFEFSKNVNTAALANGMYVLKSVDGTIAKQFVVSH